MISVVVCNQAGEYLDHCLRSIEWQTGIDFEVIVVDYMMDPPLEGAIRWDDPDPRWNHARARNVGIANAKGDRICLVNSDCVMAPDLLSLASAALDDDPTRQVCWLRFDTTRESRDIVLDDLESAFGQELGGQTGNTGNWGDFLLVYRAPVVELGGYDERCIGWGNYDTDLGMRLRRRGHPVWQGKALKLIHLWHPEQPGKMEDWHRNVRACVGSDVRNDGPETFGRYHVSCDG